MAVELYRQQLLGFMETLRDAHKVFLRNGRLMVLASIAFITTMAFSLLLLVEYLSLRHASGPIYRLVGESLLLVASPANAELSNLLIVDDLQLFVGAERVLSFFAYSAASVFLSAVTTLASALALAGQLDELSRPEFVVALAAARCWKRAIVTYFYVSIFSAGYVFLLQAILPRGIALSIVAIGISICAALLYAYLAVVWNLGMVVSVLEEKSGLEALGKAGQLVKGEGMELKGFFLNLVVTLVPFGGMQIWRFVIKDTNDSSYVLLLIHPLLLLRMYGLVAFTVLYYAGKRSHGEETEMMLDGLDNSKHVPSLPLIRENLP